MKVELKKYTIKELCEGFTFSQIDGKGLYGLAGKLTIQPEYQRNYLYAEQNGADGGIVQCQARGKRELFRVENAVCRREQQAGKQQKQLCDEL